MGDRIADLGEDALVSAIVARFRTTQPGVLVGPGDDAAVLATTGPLVVSTDTLAENFDFRRDWSAPFDVGVKVAAQNLADIAAMGARPVALLISLAAPADLPGDWATGVADGADDETTRAGAAVVGGDVSPATEIIITGTALGVLDGVAPLRRSGARSGDVVAVSGTLGPSAAGLALLLAGYRTGDAAVTEEPELARLIRAHVAPRPPYSAGPAAALAGAHALIDTSDGLLRDAGRIAAASGVVIDLDPQALPTDPGLAGAARLLGAEDPEAEVTRWRLTGGEDHALLGCFPAGTALPPGYHPIGRVLDPAPTSTTPVLVAGQPWTGPTGWTHFRPA